MQSLKLWAPDGLSRAWPDHPQPTGAWEAGELPKDSESFTPSINAPWLFLWGFCLFFFFLTFNREVLSRHTLVLISALMKPAQAVFPWHLPEILWGQLHSLPLIILTIFRANCQGTYSIPSFYVFNSFSLPISIYIEVFFFFKEIPSSFYQW